MPEQFDKTNFRVETLPPKREQLGPSPTQVGDVWHRVEGSHIGDEVYQGMRLEWTSWRCIKTTPQGAWFKCVEWNYKKPRFALTNGARTICRTKREALERLIARKVRHIGILNGEVIAAQDTLDAARTALAQCEDAAKPMITRSKSTPGGADSTLKAFRMEPGEEAPVYAATDADEAARTFFSDDGIQVAPGFPEEITDEELDAEIPEFDENECLTGRVTSIRKILAEATDPGLLYW